MGIIGELVHNMMQSTTQGMIGVSLIFIYLTWIVAMALIRIGQGMHEHH